MWNLSSAGFRSILSHWVFAGVVAMIAVATPPDVKPWSSRAESRSIHDDCRCEEDKFKWIESEKAGFDLGESAIRKWVKDHWTGYLRAKWLEHLQGKCFWVELDRGDFGLLLHQFQDQRHLLDPILDRLKTGQENLHILCWASTQAMPIESIIRILEALDINSRRLMHRFEAA